MRGSLAGVRAHILLLSLLVVAGSSLVGCSSPVGKEVETIVPRHAGTLIAERGDTDWDLVALGDSTPAGYGVGPEHSFVQIYAGYIEEDLGVTVNVHNHATGSMRTVTGWAQQVRTDESLRDDLADAEVVTLWVGSHDMVRAVGVGRGGPCYPSAGEIDFDCLQETTDRMREGFDLLFSEIVALANPNDTLILAAEMGIPPPISAAWREDGTFHLLKGPAYEVWREHLIQAANRHGIHVVATYETLNGPNGDREMPPEYLQSDRTHFNERGHRLVADLYRSVGYEYFSQATER